jgi:hypothetical protein
LAIKNLRQFNNWVAQQTKTVVPEKVILFQKSIAFDLFRRVVSKSPVGNATLWQNPSAAPPGYVGGRFRANWQITIGTPATGEVSGVAVPAPTLGAVPAFTTIWITNNVPYADRLENGWSGQAPLGIVSVSIAEIIA